MPKSEEQAVIYYTLAAGQGYAEAQRKLDERNNVSYTKEQDYNNAMKLPLLNGTYDVSKVVSYFNGANVAIEPDGKVIVEGNCIHIRIPDNNILKDKTIKIVKDLHRDKRAGNPELTYILYQTSEGKEIGIYSDKLHLDGKTYVLGQTILIQIDNSIFFEISWTIF